jgi:hypothetical protein
VESPYRYFDLSGSLWFRRKKARKMTEKKTRKKTRVRAGFLKFTEATYLAGAFFDAFLLFFGFAVALFMVSHLS